MFGCNTSITSKSSSFISSLIVGFSVLFCNGVFVMSIVVLMSEANVMDLVLVW